MNNIKNRAEEIVFKELFMYMKIFEMSFRKVNEDDILRDWLICIENYLLIYITEKDKDHEIFIDEISEKIKKIFLNKIRNMLKSN